MKVVLFFFLVCSVMPGQSQELATKIDTYLLRKQKKEPFNGTVLVVQGDTVLYNRSYGVKNVVSGSLNDSNTLYRVGSLSKPFTATAILYLQEKGLLSLSDPLKKYIPDFPHAEDITIEHLLTHSSGVAEYLGVKAVQELSDDAPPISLEKLISYFKYEPLVIRPGKKFSYSNSNYILLACIIEKISGLRYEHFIRQIIFEPLEMNSSGFDFKNQSSAHKSTGYGSLLKPSPVTDFDSTYAVGCGSLYSTAPDLYRFYKGLMNGKIISDSSRELAITSKPDKYGYGWFSYTLYNKKCVSHAGGVPGFFADLAFYPDDDVCIILLSNCNAQPRSVEKIASFIFNKKFRINDGL